jgi:hypothetical protein
MIRIVLGVSLAALATAAASWAAAGPIITRGSAALPTGCDPAFTAALVAGRATEEGQKVAYVAVIPNRELAPHQAEVRAGLIAPSGASVVHATVECSTLAILTWDATPQGGGFSSTGPCPEPKGWQADGPTVACAGLPTAWETSDDFTVKSVAQRAKKCGAVRARASAIAILRALNYGRVDAFAAAFLPSGSYQPYTASLAKPFKGRAAIRAFTKRRVAAADGWTATSLFGPVERTKQTATYSVSLVAYSSGRPVGAGNARMTLDCRSGLIRDWRGPALPLPR